MSKKKWSDIAAEVTKKNPYVQAVSQAEQALTQAQTELRAAQSDLDQFTQKIDESKKNNSKKTTGVIKKAADAQKTDSTGDQRNQKALQEKTDRKNMAMENVKKASDALTHAEAELKNARIADTQKRAKSAKAYLPTQVAEPTANKKPGVVQRVVASIEAGKGFPKEANTLPSAATSTTETFSSTRKPNNR